MRGGKSLSLGRNAGGGSDLLSECSSAGAWPDVRLMGPWEVEAPMVVSETPAREKIWLAFFIEEFPPCSSWENCDANESLVKEGKTKGWSRGEQHWVAQPSSLLFMQTTKLWSSSLLPPVKLSIALLHVSSSPHFGRCWHFALNETTFSLLSQYSCMYPTSLF